MFYLKSNSKAKERKKKQKLDQECFYHSSDLEYEVQKEGVIHLLLRTDCSGIPDLVIRTEFTFEE